MKNKIGKKIIIALILLVTLTGCTKRVNFKNEDGTEKSYVSNILCKPTNEDVTYEMEYDTYPSIYTGYPLAQYIFEGPTAICFRGSRHNPISGGDIYKYKNGRVVSSVFGNNTNYYTYTDGTSE